MLVSAALGLHFLMGQDPTVSIDLKGLRMENAAPVLAKILGIPKLTVGESIENDVLAIRASKVSAEVLKQKIAWCLNATWQQTTEGWSLSQTSSQIQQEESANRAQTQLALTASLSQAKANAGKLLPYNDAFFKSALALNSRIAKSKQNGEFHPTEADSQQFDKQKSQRPSNRFVARLLARMTPEMFKGATQAKPKLVYSSAATSLQTPFAFETSDLLKLLKTEMGQWTKGLKSQPEAVSEALNQYDAEYEIIGDPGEGDVTAVTVSYDLRDSEMSIRVYNDEGNIVLVSDGTETESEHSSPSEQGSSESKPKIQDDDAKQFAERLASSGYFSDINILERPLRPTLKVKMFQPDIIDPLSIAAVPTVFQTVKEPNFVVNLTDELLDGERFPMTSKAKDQIEGWEQMREGGWFVARPVNPIEARQHAINRPLLGPVIQAVLNTEHPASVEELASIAIALPWSNASLRENLSYLSILPPGELSPIYDQDFLRIFGSLSEEQRNTAESKGIEISTLSNSTVQEIYRAVFFGDPKLALEEAPESEAGNKRWEDLTERYVHDINHEPTFAFPKGLVKGMRLKIIEKVQLGVIGATGELNEDAQDTDDGEIHFQEPLLIGRLLFRQTKPERYGSDSYDDQNLRVGTRRSIRIRLYVNEFVYVEWSCNQTFANDSKRYTVKTLPANILQDIRKGIESMRLEDKQNTSPPNQTTKTGQKIPPR